MKNEIAKVIGEWLLGSRDYQEGVSIYTQYGPHANLSRLFIKKKMPEKLLFEMQKLAKRYPYKPDKKQSPVAQKQLAQNVAKLETVVPVNNENANQGMIETLYAKSRELMDERRMIHLSGLLESVPEKNRFENACRILDIGDELDQLYANIDIIKTTGQLPHADKKDEVEALTPIELIKRKEAVRTYLSKYKNKPEKLALFQRYEAEMVQIEKRLEAMQ